MNTGALWVVFTMELVIITMRLVGSVVLHQLPTIMVMVRKHYLRRITMRTMKKNGLNSGGYAKRMVIVLKFMSMGYM